MGYDGRTCKGGAAQHGPGMTSHRHDERDAQEAERADDLNGPAADLPFWRAKPLADMSEAEWESLCDGCGQCCLVKLEDEDTGEIHVTDIGCRLFDDTTCRCKDYDNRTDAVPDCVRLTPENVGQLPWLPQTCAYRLLAQGSDLPPWHPLVSGNARSVETAGISMRDRTIGSEDDFSVAEMVARVEVLLFGKAASQALPAAAGGRGQKRDRATKTKAGARGKKAKNV